MTPHLLGALVVAAWFAPVVFCGFLFWRERRGHRPDPVFGHFDDEVEMLERIWNAS